jgi:hypothetical protein
MYFVLSAVFCKRLNIFPDGYLPGQCRVGGRDLFYIGADDLKRAWDQEEDPECKVISAMAKK